MYISIVYIDTNANLASMLLSPVVRGVEVMFGSDLTIRGLASPLLGKFINSQKGMDFPWKKIEKQEYSGPGI